MNALATELTAQAPPPIVALADRARQEGGHLLLVGGCVRDVALGRSPRDWDVEIYGLPPAVVERMLDESGYEHSGWVQRRTPLLFASVAELPALEVSVVESLPAAGLAAGFAEQARGRDLTVNAIACDPLTRDVHDPERGLEDLAAGRLRAVDLSRFGEDPLRVLRVARFTATLPAVADADLLRCCRELALTDVAPERIFSELEATLLAPEPATGLRALRETGALAVLPELAAMIDVPQSPRWHPEGCVWTHTLMVVEQAVPLRSGDAERDAWLMWAALLHDLGKPDATQVDADGVVRSHGHDVAGANEAVDLLQRLRASKRGVLAIAALVRHHLAPAMLVEQDASDRAFRRLARRLTSAGVDADLLEHVARADHLGRTTPDALAGRFEAGGVFRARMSELGVLREGPIARVQGRDVLARGIPAGQEVGDVLSRCAEVADETGWTDATRILDRVLRERGERAST
jgi:tRNA nucleotidyltransferase (CCA-adding enzyme)